MKIDENSFKTLINTLDDFSFGTSEIQYQDPSDPETFLFGTGEVEPSLLSPPPVSIKDRGDYGYSPTIKPKPIVSPQLQAIVPQLQNVPSYPEKSLGTTVIESIPASVPKSITLVGQPEKEEITPIIESGLGVPPALATRYQILPPSTIIPSPHPPDPRESEPLPLTSGPLIPSERPVDKPTVPYPTARELVVTPSPSITLVPPPREIKEVKVSRIDPRSFMALTKK